jgi:hypothetical protein
MSLLMVTRFNNTTWEENKRWRETNEYEGCVYNSPVYIKEIVPLMITIYVIEMNNDTNKILGIGKIINKVYTDKKYNIYEERNYNRYTYRGSTRIETTDEKIEKLQKRLFKGKSHLKRGQGITQVPPDIIASYYKYIEKLF